MELISETGHCKLKASRVNAAERNRNSCNLHHAVDHSTNDALGLN